MAEWWSAGSFEFVVWLNADAYLKAYFYGIHGSSMCVFRDLFLSGVQLSVRPVLGAEIGAMSSLDVFTSFVLAPGNREG